MNVVFGWLLHVTQSEGVFRKDFFLCVEKICVCLCARAGVCVKKDVSTAGLLRLGEEQSSQRFESIFSVGPSGIAGPFLL